MTSSLTASSVPSSKRPVRRLAKRRDDRGLTTLEWLLIVAAVAGLAALAVVLVQNVVDDTSEQISGSSARKTAATIAADEIMRDADRDAAAQPSDAKTFGDWETHYKSKCDRLEITYGDAGIKTLDRFSYNGTKTDAVAAADIDTYAAGGGTGSGFVTTGPNTGLSNHTIATDKAVAHCVVADA